MPLCTKRVATQASLTNWLQESAPASARRTTNIPVVFPSFKRKRVVSVNVHELVAPARCIQRTAPGPMFVSTRRRRATKRSAPRISRLCLRRRTSLSSTYARGSSRIGGCSLIRKRRDARVHAHDLCGTRQEHQPQSQPLNSQKKICKFAFSSCRRVQLQFLSASYRDQTVSTI